MCCQSIIQEMAPESSEMNMLFGFKSAWSTLLCVLWKRHTRMTKRGPIQRTISIFWKQIRRQKKVFVQETKIILWIIFFSFLTKEAIGGKSSSSDFSYRCVIQFLSVQSTSDTPLDYPLLFVRSKAAESCKSNSHGPRCIPSSALLPSQNV